MAGTPLIQDPGAGTDGLLQAALAEDLGQTGDLTTRLLLGSSGPPARATIRSRAAGRVSGLPAAARVFGLLDPVTRVEPAAAEGQAVEAGAVLLRVQGPAASLLAGERTALNVLARLSGVATLTARFVQAVRGTGALIVDTRKTTPGWRVLEKAAVRHGGGANHRMGLYDEVLLKENHFAVAAPEARADVVARVRAGAPEGTRIVVEARDAQEARAAADGGADVVLLDNLDRPSLAAAVRLLADHPRRAAFALEASGGVGLHNVAELARTGVERISVGALTHSAPALDLSMQVEALA